MNKKILGVCDLDKDYATVLSHYISRKEGNRFSVMAFSVNDSLMEFLKNESFDVLLMSDTFAESIENYDEVLAGSKRTLILASSKDLSLDDGCEVVYKFQSADHILAKILEGCMDDGPKKNLGRSTQMIGVFSPIRRCGKTRFSYALSRELAKKARTVFISLDDFCAMDILKSDDECMSISDFIYLALTEESSFKKKIKFEDGVDVVLSANSPIDIRTSDGDTISAAIKKVLECGNYKYCVLDVGDAVREQEKLLASCDVVYVPVIRDSAAGMKLAEWVNYERETGNEKLAMHLQRIELAGGEDELTSVARDLVRPGR